MSEASFFFTNYDSRIRQELAENLGALVFYWPDQERSLRGRRHCSITGLRSRRPIFDRGLATVLAGLGRPNKARLLRIEGSWKR